jgi:DNA polymerase III gamma/tau subunit
MSFKEIKGNRKSVERMSRAIINRSISHAYLLEGDRSVDKLGLAENFVKAILCKGGEGDCCDSCPSCTKINHGNHEDVIYLAAEGNSIKDEAVEELQSRLKKKPYVGDRNIVILQDADTMTLRAQNRLLKTLEEPAPGTVMILLSENMESLAQTILSRCVIFKLNPYGTAGYEEVLDGAVEIADMLLAGKPFYEISRRISGLTESRDAAFEFLDAMESWYRDLAVSEYDTRSEMVFHADRIEELRKRSRLYPRNAVDRAVAAIEEAKNDLNRNLNIGYTIKNMILKMIA